MSRPVLAPLVVLLVAASCRGGESAPPATPEPVAGPTPSLTAKAAPVPTDLLLPGMATGQASSSVELPPLGERPPCAKDEDCWSSTCCPATKAEHCVHASLAQKCAAVDVKCAKSDVRYDCLCTSGQCEGRLHP